MNVNIKGSEIIVKNSDDEELIKIYVVDHERVVLSKNNKKFFYWEE